MALLDPKQINLVLRGQYGPERELAHQALDKVLPETAGKNDENDAVLMHLIEASSGE
jgi:hypothetical protein